MRGFLSGEAPGLGRARRVLRRLPSAPHCKLCAAPFEGPAGAVLRHVGFARYPGNPAICSSCIKGLNKVGVFGAEVPVSLLFADIRGSTGLGERMSPSAFRAFLDRFYRLSSEAILGQDGVVDKFVGDEAIGLFLVGTTGKGHAAAAVRAARALLAMVGRPDATAEGAIPVGAAVHTGEAFVGSTGSTDAVTDFTALGDVVNTTARLASEAAAGELLVTTEAARAAGVDVDDREPKTIEIRGRERAVAVYSLASDDRVP
jgi:adenylate cyclase